VSKPLTLSRRSLLRQVSVALPLAALAGVAARVAHADATPAPLPLLTSDDPQAKTLKYVADAKQSKDAKPDATCASCALYQGPYGSAQGPCQLFPGKAVKASGWCSAWSPQM
jgi:hypothetical protein